MKAEEGEDWGQRKDISNVESHQPATMDDLIIAKY